MLSILEDLSGMSLAVFTRLLGWDRIELELFLQEVRKEWKRKDVHAYWPLYVFNNLVHSLPFLDHESEILTDT
jgi:hypothetical protein